MSNQPAEPQTAAELAPRIRQFIYETFPQARQAELADSASLLDSGIVDSMGVLEIVSFLETDLGITLSDEEMLADNFDSIESIARFVHAKQSSSPSSS